MDVAVTVVGPTTSESQKIVSKEALQFVGKLHRAFNSIREDLLRRREARQNDINNGVFPDFLPETSSVRDDPTWKGPPPAPGLIDRRVEITGPTDRKMVVNALNSDVKTYMADFEDSSAPTWSNMLNGQVNLFDAIRRDIDFTLNGKKYALRKDKELPTLIVRPRGLHMVESHVLVDGNPISASIFDFGIYFFHNAKELIARGAGPYFYLPKLESHLEARLWNNIFNVSQDILGIPRGTIRATVLIETILAAFEMDEIIFELRDHSSGLNCGRWDYIFSFIKKFRFHKSFVLPERKAVTMNAPFMKAYVQLLIKTCHKRGVHAMGGMAALIPIKNDPKANGIAMDAVKADKLREVTAGHDGTWVAHPALASLATDVFNEHMPTPNQIFKEGKAQITSKELLNAHVSGGISSAGLRKNIEIAMGYVEAWLRSVGCVPIDNLMEDAATAEVSRSQLWQWARHGAITDDGVKVTAEHNLNVLRDVTAEMMKSAPRGNKVSEAAEYLAKQITGDDFSDFLTTALYEKLNVDSLPRHNSRL